MTFKDFKFHKDLLKGVRIAGFREPSPIQKMVIPIIANGEDLVGQAHTGTGKTAAFGLPLMDKIAKREIERALEVPGTKDRTCAKPILIACLHVISSISCAVDFSSL